MRVNSVELEVSVEQRVVGYIEALSPKCWAPKMGKEGWPDRLILLGQGRHCWFEFKRAKFGSLTPAQKRRLPAMRLRGEHVYIIRSLAQARDALARELLP